MAHIPDGFLTASVAAGTFAAAAALTAYAARKTRDGLDDRAAPTLGLATAAVFAAQTVNFPVAAGTSGHLLGGTLVAVLFGPWAGFLVMTAVVIAQALIFADGGLTALGANVLNIAGMGAVVGYGIYYALTELTGAGSRRHAVAAAIATYFATVLTGAAAGFELGLSGIAPTRIALTAMVSFHALLGLAEALITGLVVFALARKRPNLLFVSETALPRTLVLVGLGAVACLAGLLSLIASTAPDALERVAMDLGFADAGSNWEGAPLAAYRTWLPGIAGTVTAVVLGIALLFAGVAAMARALTRLRQPRES